MQATPTLTGVQPDRPIPTINAEHKEIGQYGFIALAVDCEGNMIGPHSMK